MLGAIPSIQSPKARLLLANHEDGLHGIRSQMRQVLAICTNIESSSEGTYVHVGLKNGFAAEDLAQVYNKNCMNRYVVLFL